MKKIFVIICILMLFSTLPMATGLVNNSNNNIQISDNYETDWWKISRHDPTHSGYSFSTAPNTSNLVGTMTIGPDYVPNGEPLVYDGKIYITSFKEEGLFGFGWIHCFNVSTGGLVWSHKFESSLFAGVAGIPAINGNNIFLSVVYDFSSVLECRDKDTGTLLWDKDFYEYSIDAPIIDNDKIYAFSIFNGPTDLGCLYCLDALNMGSILWETPIDLDINRYSDPIISNIYGKVVLAAVQDIICFDIVDGSIEWTYHINDNARLFPIVSNEGKVYVSTHNGEIYCLDLIGNGDGTTDLLWTKDVGIYIDSYPALAYGNIYIGSDYLYCLDAETGDEIWGYYTHYTDGSPTIADGKIFVAYDMLLCLDAIGNGDGTTDLIWSYNISGFAGCSAIVANNAVFTCNRNCTISVFKDLIPNGPYPPTINGPSNGQVNVYYNYTFNSIDPDNDNVYYWIEWGDNTNEEWIGPYASGEDATVSHAWSKNGNYIITAKAKDATGIESNWASFNVIIPRNRGYFLNFNLLEKLLTRFPNAFPFIRYMLGLL